ncbi:MAG: M48 family metallopeptidase [Pseudomonadales bacterium]|nr:M48 family metallopeptidase [Pseudomonadales bacterium]
MQANRKSPLEYTVTRSRRKTVALYIRNNSVEVRAPHFVSKREIHDWVHTKADWIEKRLKQQQQKKYERPLIQDGENLLFMGSPKKITVTEGKNQVDESGSQIIISSKKPNDHEINQALLEKWLKQEAQHYIDERCLELATCMQVQDQISMIKYRKTKTKWGHCTSTGILQFNWLIIMAPVEVIDYLLIHELSHLSHMNHSHQFWHRVASFCPDYQQHRKWLNEQGHKISL